jgi:anti-sigma factor RsiW
MTCEQARALLSAHLDRELDLAKSLEMEEHLRECQRCAAASERHEVLRSALGAASLAFAPPPRLEQRVRKALHRDAGPSTRMFHAWRWAAVPLAATMAAVLSWTVATHDVGTSAADHLTAELVSGHVRSLMADHLVDVATSDQHTVRPWFNGKVDFAPPVTDFTANGFPLVGGRVDYIAGRPVAVVVYKRRQHVVNVFIWPSGNDVGQEPRSPAPQGYHLLRWTRSGLTFWAVSDVSAGDLERLAQLFQESG